MTSDDIDGFTEMFKALSDPIRVTIVLNFHGRMLTPSDISDEIGKPLPVVSYHLHKLYDAGIVINKPSGRWNNYCLDPGILDELMEFVDQCRVYSRPSIDATCKGFSTTGHTE